MLVSSLLFVGVSGVVVVDDLVRGRHLPSPSPGTLGTSGFSGVVVVVEVVVGSSVVVVEVVVGSSVVVVEVVVGSSVVVVEVGQKSVIR